MKKIILILLCIFIFAVTIASVSAMDNSSEEISVSVDNNVIASSYADVTHTYSATGKSVYVKDFNPKYKLSSKAKKQMKSVKKASKKTYSVSIDDETYQSLKYAKKTKTSDYYTFDTNYKCKVLKPVFKSKTVKKTIINKKYYNQQEYINDYNKYFQKYNSGKYNMKVKYHFYKGTNNIKYATIKVTKKVKQVKIVKFKTGYTKVRADIMYTPHNGELSKGSHLLFYGNVWGYDFTNYVASKHNFI